MFCENVLKRPIFIALTSVGVVIVLCALMHSVWITALHQIVGKWINLSESERVEYMLEIAGQVDRRQELEQKFREEAQQRTLRFVGERNISHP